MAPNDNNEDRDHPTSLEPETGLDDIWSSIGPGGTRPGDSTPPTIRPYDLMAKDLLARSHDRGLPTPGVEPMSMSEPSPDPHPRRPKMEDGSDPTDHLRDELRLGVRMIEALENQMQRAERLIRLEEEASRTLADRMNTVDSIDTRLEEIEATVATVERRLERQASGSQETAPRSGSLSINDVEDSENGPTESESPDREMLERAQSIRSDLRRELEAICTATASLAEVVEQANRTEQILRGTLETASGKRSDSDSPAWTVSSILRRLAEEFDVQSTDVDGASGKTSTEGKAPLIMEIDATNESVSPPSGAPSIKTMSD